MFKDDHALAVMGRTRLLQPRTEDVADTDGLAWLDDVYRYAFARLGSREDAEDATMEVFLAVNARPDRLRDADDPRIYLIGIARRKVVDTLRKRHRNRFPPVPAHKEATDGAENRQIVAHALGKLPENQREVLILKYVHEMSVQEIAKVVRKSPQAVNSLLQRGREGFRHGATGLFEGGVEVRP